MASTGIRMEWEGRRPAQTVIPPAPFLRVQELYGDAESDGWRNRLIEGDNLAAMAALHAEYAGKIALIYLDPPFYTGAEWRAQATGGMRDQTLPAYSDHWGGNLGSYLQWLLDRLTLARELLNATGSLYLHLSWRSVHYARLLLDEIFGAERFQNEIVWCYREAINSKKRWNRKHDTLLFYTKGERFTFNPDPVRMPYKDSNIKKYRMSDERGAYRLMGRGITGSPLRSRRDLPAEYETQFPDLTYRHYLGQGTLPVDYWMIDIENQASRTRTGYPTQKPEALLERILLASTNPGDLVADLCCGSGTTLAVAQRVGRRWIGCDLGSVAIHTCRKRLLEAPVRSGFTVEGAATMHYVGQEAQQNMLLPKSGSVLTPALPEPEEQNLFTCALADGELHGPQPLARLEPRDGGMVVELSDEWARSADMWAVEWLADEASDESAGPLQPDWWSARTRRCPQLQTTSSPRPPGRANACRIALIDAGGALTVTTLKDVG